MCYTTPVVWLLILLASIVPIRADDLPADLLERELVLISDASASMYRASKHHELQLNGYVLALKDPEVIAALTVVPTAVRVMFYGGSTHIPSYDIGPHIVQHAADVDRLILMIQENTPRVAIPMGTRQCRAVLRAVKLPRIAVHRIYDLVTDEPMHDPATCLQAKTQAEYWGDTINVIGIDEASDTFNRNQFETYLVSRMPAGFLMKAATWEDFTVAIKHKLLLELNM